MNNQILSRISILALAVIMLVFGSYHFMKPQNLASYIPSYLPGGILWVYVTGAAFILAAVAFIINKYVKLAAYLLAIMLVIFVLSIQLPNYMNAGNDMDKQLSLVNVLKDIAMAAFALHIGANSAN